MHALHCSLQYDKCEDPQQNVRTGQCPRDCVSWSNKVLQKFIIYNDYDLIMIDCAQAITDADGEISDFPLIFL